MAKKTGFNIKRMMNKFLGGGRANIEQEPKRIRKKAVQRKKKPITKPTVSHKKTSRRRSKTGGRSALASQVRPKKTKRPSKTRKKKIIAAKPSISPKKTKNGQDFASKKRKQDLFSGIVIQKCPYCDNEMEFFDILDELECDFCGRRMVR